MKPSFKTLLRGVLAAGIVSVLAGCLVVKVTVNDPHQPKVKDGGTPADGQYHEPCPSCPEPPLRAEHLEPPAVVTGSLAVPINLAQNNTGAYNCFPSSQGWDRYYLIITNFNGKSVTPNAFSFTNKVPKQTTFTVKTCNPHNGAMETGILTFDMFAPGNSSLWVCRTNAGGACLDNGNLSILTRTMSNTRSYRAIVFYKSGTLGTNETVKVEFSYP